MYQDSSYIFISVLSVVFIFGFETESDLHIKKLSQYKTQLLIPNSELINGIFSSKIIIFRTYECFLLCDFSVNTLANNCFKNKKNVLCIHLNIRQLFSRLLRMMFIEVALNQFYENRVTQFLWILQELGVRGKLQKNSWTTYLMQFHLSS